MTTAIGANRPGASGPNDRTSCTRGNATLITTSSFSVALGDKTFEFNELSHLRKQGIGERFSSCLRAGPILLAFSGANQESDNV